MIDPDRDVMWTVNTVWGQLHVVRWDGEGPLQSWPITGAIMPQSVHSIAQSRDWLIIGDCAYEVEPQVMSGGERTVAANASGPLYLIRKDALESTAPGREVSCTAFHIAPEINHYYAVYDDTDGVRVLFEHTENADIAMTQGPGDLHALGRPCDPALLWPTEETPPLLISAAMPHLAMTAHHEFALDDFPSSPIFVPRDPGAPGRSRHAGSDPGGHDGHVVVPVMHDDGFRVEVFDAADVGRGPLAVLAAPGNSRSCCTRRGCRG